MATNGRYRGSRLTGAGAALLVTLGCPAALGEEIRGTAEILDGDSLRLGAVEIRLQGIDAPEGRQTCTVDGRAWRCGRSAARALDELIGEAPVRCVWTQRDRYGRALATCFKDGTDINSVLVARGMAVAYTHYSDRYLSEEALARSRRLGLWRSQFVAPWIWRHSHASPRQRR